MKKRQALERVTAMQNVRIATLVVVLSAGSVPLGADFPVILQAVCDVDLPTCEPASGIQGLRGVRQVALSPDGKHAYAAVALDDALIVFSIHSATGKLTFVESFFDTDVGIDGLDSARSLAVSPDGKNVYVAALVDSSISWYDRDSGTGKLTFNAIIKDTDVGIDGLGGAHAVVVSPDGEHVYVAARSEDEVSVFTRAGATGDLTFLEIEDDGVGGVDGLDAAEALALSPDGEHLYVAGENDNAVAVFERETAAGANFGKLTFLEVEREGVGGVDGMTGANGVAVSPDGDNVYVACERTGGGGDWAAVFTRDDNSMSGTFGELTFVQDLQEEDFGTATTGIFAFCTGVGPDNSGVAVTPDDSQAYLTNPFRGTVAVFDRSVVDGSLTLSDSICDLGFGTEGLAGTVAISLNADGSRAYTAASSFETVSVVCTDPDDDIDLSDAGTVSVDTTEIGCNSITAGGDISGYIVDNGAEVVFVTSEAILTNGFEVLDGTFIVTDRDP
ncbi:MAG: lactonase family protein [bacterium]|nr:lactonase family protein [bacterium]